MADTSRSRSSSASGASSPARTRAPHWQDYRIEATPGMTVLDGLWKIKELHAPTLAWRSSCRMGVCGSCGMLINGRPRLACNTQISELGTDVIAVGAAAQLRHHHATWSRTSSRCSRPTAT